MSTPRSTRLRAIRRAMGTGILAMLMMASAGLADDSRKLDRQIELFERIVDDMLVESPNWLVQGRHETRGRYRSGQGASFTFDVDLVNRGWSRGGRSWWKGWSHGWDDDDDVIVIDIDDLDDLDADELKDLKGSREKSRQRSIRKEERLYERGKAEMVDVFLDYGDLLTSMPAGETLELKAYLEDAELFYDKDLRELSMTAKMSDLRAYSEGKIDKKQMVSKITVTEE